MATPTPMKHASSQQGRTPSTAAQGRTPSQLAAATPPVSTPFSSAAQAAFSPRGPRGSPHQVKKSPATSGLMTQPNMGALNFDSPSTAAAMGALGMGGSFDVGLDGGMDALTASFDTEDEKLRRLDAILKMLNQKKGFVSDAGIERLAQRLGMELLSEEQTNTEGRKIKTFTIAGSAIAMDIALDNNVVQSATLSYHGNASSLNEHFERASDILLRDLQLRQHQSPLTKTLDSFAANFERLAVLDKLSVVPGLDCHEALAGIYTSLARLHEWDVAQLKAAPETSSTSEQAIAALATSTRNGNPTMHANDTVGLAMQYWQEHHLTPGPSDKTWSMLLGCAPIEGLGLPPARVSDTWISKDIIIAKKEGESATLDALDWQDPENVKLPTSEENKDAGMEVIQADLSTARVPRVMFTATFDPPVILPQSDWARLYGIAGIEPPALSTDFGQAPPTFDALFFPAPAGSKQDPSESRSITQTAAIDVFEKDGQAASRVLRNTLYIYKPIYAQEISELPFSHPRQLVDMLPLLRQYAFLSTLLQNSFKKAEAAAAQSSMKSPAGATTTFKNQLSDFMDVDKEAPAPDMDVDVILWVHPSPQMQVVFPMGSSTANISLRILGGGQVEITAENVLGDGRDNSKKSISREALAKALEYLEDLGKWAEWIRTRLA